MPSLIVMAGWRDFGFDMVIFLAAMQGVPWYLYEAASVDGAGRWERFRRITLPMLRPTLLFAAVTDDRLHAVLRGAVRDDQGRAAQQHALRVVHDYFQFGVGNYGYAERRRACSSP